MNWNKLTIKAQEAVSDAQKKAESLHHQQIECEHMLFALVSQKEGVVKPILDKLGANSAAILNDLEGELRKMPQVEGSGEVYISQRLKKAIDGAFDEAERMKDERRMDHETMLDSRWTVDCGMSRAGIYDRSRARGGGILIPPGGI